MPKNKWARRQIHPSLAPDAGRSQRIEFEYERGGALQYLAAWDIFGGLAMGRCEQTTGIDSFMRLVEQVMTQEVMAWVATLGDRQHIQSLRGNRSHEKPARLSSAHRERVCAGH